MHVADYRRELHELFRLGGGKLFVECNHQEMAHAKGANQGDFVPSSGEQMRRCFRPQYFFRMRIERDHDRRAIRSPGVLRGS